MARVGFFCLVSSIFCCRYSLISLWAASRSSELLLAPFSLAISSIPSMISSRKTAFILTIFTPPYYTPLGCNNNKENPFDCQIKKRKRQEFGGNHTQFLTDRRDGGQGAQIFLYGRLEGDVIRCHLS